MPPFNRVLIKLSGDALGGSQGFGLDQNQLDRFVKEVQEALKTGLQIGVVVGGGNILRGSQQEAKGQDRASSDQMGMLATVINALAIEERMTAHGLACKVFSSVLIEGVAERFSHRVARAALDAGTLCVFAGGTGNPFFTTDSAAALRAAEIKADLLIKATKVDGVYDKDPVKYPDAVRFDKISYKNCIEKNLRVMDTTAFALCSENHIPIRVFNFNEQGRLARVLGGEALGSLVSND